MDSDTAEGELTIELIQDIFINEVSIISSNSCIPKYLF